MTDQRELDRLLGAIFVEGSNEVADRVIDAALIEIDQTRQRRVGRMPRRLLNMTTPMRVAAAAVIGVIAVGGTLYAVSPLQSAVAPSSTADSSTGPSTSPSLSIAPAAGPSWTVTGKMVIPRPGGSATLLPDGTVLVAGGGSAGRFDWAELYDPRSGTWSATGQLGQFTGETVAVSLPDGTVLVGTSDLYDPQTKSWTTTGGAGMPRSPDGGFPGGFEAMFVLRDGKVLALGQHARTALYDLVRQSWTASGMMVTSRSHFASALLADGRVLVVGGEVSPGQATASAEVFDTASGTWTETGSLNVARDNLTATLLPNGKVLAIGGGGGGPYDPKPAVAELYDPTGGSWTATAMMVSRHVGQSATVLSDGTVLVAGGVEGVIGLDSLWSAELFDPSDETWTATAELLTRRSGHTATLLADGRVLVFGGVNDRGQVGGAEIYDPGLGS